MQKHLLKIKISLFVLSCFIALSTLAQDKKPFDGPAWNPPYHLPLEGWGIERFLIPIEFAPKIPYTGVEDIRFTKGWSKAESPEYWSYAFLWLVDGNPVINAAEVTKNMNLYYDGLVSRNIEKRNIPAALIKKTIAKIKLIKSEGEDLKTFNGTISMLDYMAQKPMVLNLVVHVRKCPGLNKTIIFHQLSPKPATAQVWKDLTKLYKDFKCADH